MEGTLKMSTIRIPAGAQATLRQMAVESARPMQDIAAEAIEAYRRQQILERTNAVYATMRGAPDVRAEELEERAVWDVTLNDGLGQA